jgi:SET domain
MAPNTITIPKSTLVSRHTFADVLQNSATGQKSLHATVSFNPGEMICLFGAGITQSYATYLTVQTAVGKHITLMPEFLQYINHSCEPNVFFDTARLQLICLRPLEPGDELTFFYPSTEWEMAQPFVCNCGHDSCLQLINGASHLSPETLRKYRLTDFITSQAKLKQLL